MALSKYLVYSMCAAAVVASAACADGTGQALTPTLPTTNTTTSADGSLLKATTPGVSSPRGLVRVTTLTPQLAALNASGTFDPSTPLSYQFEVSEATTVVATSDPIAAASDTLTLWTVPENVLALNRTYTWRVRAMYGSTAGSWSGSAGFRTPLPPPVDGPVACDSSAGAEIVRCVGRAYPKYLVETDEGDGSLERRQHNMAFIRDRIIETGICKGLDLARNFKRGTPVISHDFLVWRSDRDRGVDIATGYDDVTLPLRLKWQVFGADDNYGHPFYAQYPPVDCTNLAAPQ